MRLCLFSERSGRDNSRWASLPALCCQAAGGNPEHTDPVAAAWFLFYKAADIMDSIEDRDELGASWGDGGPGTALSVATGLYFSASLALNRLETVIGSSLTARQLREEILRRFLEMSGGQHLDITQPHPSLEQYWQIAHAKSGAFFSLACWAGARVATRHHRKLQGFQRFGLNVGLLIQVLDDLHDYLELSQSNAGSPNLDLGRSLPAVYVREVAPESVKRQFEAFLDPGCSHQSANQIFTLIEQYGGVLYLNAELDKLRQSALDSLDSAEAAQPAQDQLISLLDELHTFE